MAERSGFFNATKTGGVYDRQYDASDFADMLKLFFKTGVFVNPANQLKVMAGSGRNLTVKAGAAFIEGYWYVLDEDKTISIAANTGSSATNSVVCLQLNIVTKDIKIVLKNNQSSLLPVRSGSIYELVLATVSVGAGVVTITDSDITDRRANSTYCGFISGTVDQIDTTDLFAQFEDAFNTWFNDIKGQLSGDVATSLAQRVTSLENTVGAMPMIRSGTSDPSNSTGDNGDVYIKITG